MVDTYYFNNITSTNWRNYCYQQKLKTAHQRRTVFNFSYSPFTLTAFMPLTGSELSTSKDTRWPSLRASMVPSTTPELWKNKSSLPAGKIDLSSGVMKPNPFSMTSRLIVPFCIDVYVNS